MKNIPAKLKNIFSLILLTSTIALFGCGQDTSSKIDGKGGEFIPLGPKQEKQLILENWLEKYLWRYNDTRDEIFISFFSQLTLEKYDEVFKELGYQEDDDIEETKKMFYELGNILNDNKRPDAPLMKKILTCTEAFFMEFYKSFLTDAAKERLEQDKDAFLLEMDKHMINFFLEIIDKGGEWIW